MATEEELADKGLAMMRTLWGPGVGTGPGTPAQQFAPEFYDYVRKTCFGMVWSRPTLDPKTREMLTLTVLTALGRNDELMAHLIAAKNLGITRDEVVELITHVAVYAGVPAGNSAMGVAAQVFGGD